MPLVAAGALTISDVNDGLSALLTQEAFVVSTETDGSGGDFSLAATTLNVYMGGTDVSAHWQITALPSVGVTGNLVGRTYTVTSLSPDAGYVDLVASRIGYPSLTSRFSISKAKRGAPGKNFSIVASRPGFTFRDGVADPASQVISLTVVRQNLTEQALYFASNGASLKTDEGVLSLRGYLHGTPGAGSGDTCYVELEDLGDANEMHVTVVVGEVTQVAHIPRIEMTTGQRGTIQTARAIIGTVWSDVEAATAITEAGGGSPLRGDVVTLYNTGAGFSQTRVRTTEGAWAALAAFFGGDVLVDGSIIADKIAAQAILSAHIGANQIVGTHIAANQISAGHITSGAISTQKLLVSGAGNALNPDPAFEDADYWAALGLSGGSRAITAVSNAYAGNKVMRITGYNVSWPETPNFFAIDPTKTYLLEILAREVVGPTRFYGVWQFRDASGALIPFTANGAWGGNSNSWYFPSNAILPSGGAWTRYTLAVGPNGAAQFPANARFMGFGWLANYSEAATDVMDFGMVRVSEMGRGELIVDGAITSSKLTTGELITLSAQIKDAIITDAKIASLSAAKLQAGTALAGSLTVSGTALSTIDERAADPAARINLGPITKVDPGKITVSGATTLADWRRAGDLTRIDGGAISANTIDANKLTIGNRNIKFEGLQFEHNSPSTDRVSWTSGVISYVGDDGNISTRTITAGNVLWSAATLYLYWVKDATTISSTTAIATAMAPNNVVLAAYKGNTDLVTDYGRTIIDGSKIKTGSIDTNQIKANAITSGLIAAGAITSEHIEVGSLNANVIGAGRLSSAFLEVTDTMIIDEADAGFSMGKASAYDTVGDGIFMGRTLEPDDSTGFGFIVGRSTTNHEEYIQASKQTGLVLHNAKFQRVFAQPGSYVDVTAGQTIDLTAGGTIVPLVLSLEMLGGGSGGSGASPQTITNPGNGGAGGNTIVQLYDDTTLIATYTANGAAVPTPGWLSSRDGTGGESSVWGTGGVRGRRDIDVAATAGTGYGAGGGGGSARDNSVAGRGGYGGKAASLLSQQNISIASLALPKLVITIGAGGAGGADEADSSPHGAGAAGSPGKVRYKVDNGEVFQADVVPLKPTAAGTMNNTGPFPNLGAGLWVLSYMAGDSMGMGLVEVDDAGRRVRPHSSSMATFMSQKTPVYISGGGSARTINYLFYKMGPNT
ncbi:MAG: hypothetical protein EOR77_30795 [Mesorhizobium sp.]|uniref:hypothetical protein n=1 Tax=Mesorhizobium sp. TaxID=1871066 RepID=UPI000FE4857F|nr:hypothetical protein [Mesorhizobium sp.]RWM27910.1 MAG: hypothetical protein EOR77_30795 [Mesorhizobium sp.]